MDKQEKYKKWVVDDLLKNTLVEVYSSSINFTTPRGILQRQDDVCFYDETIQVLYGIPDDYKIIKVIEQTYRDILVDLYYDYDIWPVKFKDGESVYDYLQRTTRPLTESLSDEEIEHEKLLRKKEKYREFIITDMINKTSWVTQMNGDDMWWDVEFKFFQSVNWHYVNSREEKFAYDEGDLINSGWGEVQDAHVLILSLSYGVRRDKTEEAQSIYDEYWDRMCRIMLEGSNVLTHINEATDKKVKYKEFVVGELLKQVNFRGEYIYFPWILSSLAHHYSSANTLFHFNKEEVRNLGPYTDVHFDDDDMFHSYVRDRYGVKENEANSIWLRLKKRLLDLAPEIE
jgi:hypothetical protein